MSPAAKSEEKRMFSQAKEHDLAFKSERSIQIYEIQQEASVNNISTAVLCDCNEYYISYKPL